MVDDRQQGRRRVPLSRAVSAVLRPYWRLVRGLTLGAQGVVIDGEGRILLVRHGYRPGWHFPGGGVEWNETVETALRRELAEETGVVAVAEPVLHGVFANFEKFPGDHILVYVVRQWQRPRVPEPNQEIAETAFFDPGALPEGTTAATRRRIDEILGRAPVSPQW
jgi:ADP-ribose pyrophosphatase YjhB (NUDIX family)